MEMEQFLENLSTGRPGNAMTNTQTRAVIMGGRDDSTNDTNVIEYVTIASTGDAIDFGDLTIVRRSICCNIRLSRWFRGF